MLKLLLLFFLFPVICCAQDHKILLEDFSFLVNDGEVNTLRQSKDILYELHSTINSSSEPDIQKHYKIIASHKSGEFAILKLERLDTISMTTDPYPPTRYSVAAFKMEDPLQLGYLPLLSGLTLEQIDTVQTNIESLKDKFFFTYYSATYLKQLSNYKRITTKEQANEIIEMMQNDKYKSILEKYKQTEPGDMYGSGFMAEILVRACIDNGYNPIGAGQAVNYLLK